MKSVFKYLHWTRLFSVAAASTEVPPLPGVYAYAEVDKISNLPTKINWIYIGRTNNLSNRLSQHENFMEPNLDLKDWLFMVPHDHGELWYTTPAVKIIKQMERVLIKELKPKFNRIQYLKGPPNESKTQ